MMSGLLLLIYNNHYHNHENYDQPDLRLNHHYHRHYHHNNLQLEKKSICFYLRYL